MQKILLKIDVMKIAKADLYVGQKGTYLDAILIPNTTESKYGDDGFIAQSISKEKREAGQKGPIIGNWRYLADDNRNTAPEVEDDSVPF
jgi:hypothetical protein